MDIVERGILTALFEKYFPSLMLRQQEFRRTTPVTDMAMIQMTCHLLECLLDDIGNFQRQGNDANPHALQQADSGPDALELALEVVFAYATIWGFGSALYQDHIVDSHRDFHKWWTSEFKDVKFPPQGTIFDYYLDVRTQKFQRWDAMETMEKFDYTDPEIPLQVGKLCAAFLYQ